MGLWREHFHWRVLLRWDVLAWSTGILLAVGGILLVFDQFGGANVCFIITALLVFGKVLHIGIESSSPTWERMLFTFVLFGLVGIGIVETVRGVNSWRIKHELKPPDEPAAFAGATATVEGEASSSKPPIHKPASHKAEPPITQGVEIAGPTPSKDVQLLDRAVEAVRSCHSFQDSSFKRMQEATARIQEHDSQPDVTEESKARFKQWAFETVQQEDMQLYSQVYKQEFMEVRRLVAPKVPDAVEGLIDYENPRNMGGVTGVCFDLERITEAYIDRLYSQGAITIEDGRRYLQRLKRQQK